MAVTKRGDVAGTGANREIDVRRSRSRSQIQQASKAEAGRINAETGERLWHVGLLEDRGGDCPERDVIVHIRRLGIQITVSPWIVVRGTKK